ncbi:uncharacterized protein LOC144108215 [Amblyomma americanum]
MFAQRGTEKRTCPHLFSAQNKDSQRHSEQPDPVRAASIGAAEAAARLRLSSPHHHPTMAAMLADIRRTAAMVPSTVPQGAGRYKCPFCTKAFAHQWHLGRHVRIHTGDRPFRCHVCPMAFNQKSTLIGHLRRHTGDKPYQCHLCRMVFSWKSTLVKHLQQHAVQATCVDSSCQAHCELLSPLADAELDPINGRVAGNVWSEMIIDLPSADGPGLRRHHSGALHEAPMPSTTMSLRPYKCSHCGKAFADQWHLKRHVRIHTGDRPFSCPFCPMAFNQKNTLIGHMRRHTGDKPYRCQICGIAFSWKSTFVKHVQLHETEHQLLPTN